MNRQQLPKTDSIQELAKFWDTRDLTDIEEELEEVGERTFERDANITVHLETDDANALHAIANARGVADSDLIREWVQELGSSIPLSSP